MLRTVFYQGIPDITNGAEPIAKFADYP